MRLLTILPLTALALALLLLISGQSAPASAQLAPTLAPTAPDFRVYIPLVTQRMGVQPPALKWQRGGCYSTACEMGWYASPAVADLDHDGRQEVIGTNYLYSLVLLDGPTGALEQRVHPEHNSVFPSVIVADLEGNGSLEVLTANYGGYLYVFDQAGAHLAWSARPTTSDIRGLSAYDLDHDGSLEIIVTAAVSSRTNTWVYEHNGALRPGWPQLNNDSGEAWGVYNDSAAVGDLDGDGKGEIVVPSDMHFICAYEANGVQIPAHPMYGNIAWGAVAVFESLATELRGWGACDGTRAESYRPTFDKGVANIVDLNGDGQREVVVTAKVYDCHAGFPPSRYMGVYIFNADRSRFNAGGFDWRAIPVDTGAPISEDQNIIENAVPNPVVVDLDNDGLQEILFPSFDGRMHAFWLDKTEHGSWPFSVYNRSEGFYRFASEPVVVDLDNNGYAEVIFASWTQKGSNRTGRLHILDYLGNLLQQVDLPPAVGANWNGALAAPTLANLDGDPDLELVLNTAHSGFVAYDLPSTSQARILWGTGRGGYLRNGFR